MGCLAGGFVRLVLGLEVRRWYVCVLALETGLGVCVCGRVVLALGMRLVVHMAVSAPSGACGMRA